jgi:eukaryotic-like serine/threonine-protein kinase
MGVVYRAHDIGLSRDVAIKVINEEFRYAPVAVRRFVEEAQITGQLQHPAIPAVHQIGSLSDGSPFLAMKLIKGETLAAILARPDRDRAALVATFQRVAEAVGYAHSRGVIHRDLKPSNVMAGAFGEVQVMDWGLAKVLRKGGSSQCDDGPVFDLATVIDAGRAQHPDSETQAGSVMGTPAYMPPEQAGGELDKVDERSDVFGLGSMLCEILTGEPPYRGRKADVVRLMAVRGQVADAFARLDSCGAEPELVALCTRCLSPYREDRPIDGGEVATAVADFRAAAEERARQAELDRVRAEGDRAKAELQAAEQAKRKRIVLALGVSLASLIAVAGGAAWYVQKERADRERAEAIRVHEEEELRREQAILESQTRAGVDGILHQLPDLYRRAQWDEATTLLDEADGLISPDEHPGLRVRVAEARMNTVVLRRLDRIRLDREIAVNGRSNRLRAPRDYHLAFQESGFDVPGDDSAAVAVRLKASPIREYLLGGLDDWAIAETGSMREQLCAAADAVAGVQWRTRMLAAAASGANLSEWLHQVPEPQRVAGVILLAARLTREIGGDSLVVLEDGIRQHPTDIWLHLAYGEIGDGMPTEILVGAYRTALAIRPETAVVHNNLGTVLYAQGDRESAVREFREAARLDNRLCMPRANLGVVLDELGDRAGAAQEIREAMRLNPGQAAAHRGLGLLLAERGDRAGAAREFREALRLDPGSAATHDNLGSTLDGAGDLRAAVREFREAVRLEPGNHSAHFDLGTALAKLADLSGATTALRNAIRLQPRNRAYHHALVRIEHWQTLLPRLPDIAAGRATPKDAAEAIAVAELCGQPFQRRYAAAVRLTLAAFAANPSLAEDHGGRYRYTAATHAALAMAGHAIDLSTLDVSEWAYLSNTAHRWLREELAVVTASAKDTKRSMSVTDTLTNWKTDPDLVTIRDREWLAAMPSVDRERWQAFWADVDVLLGKVSPR